VETAAPTLSADAPQSTLLLEMFWTVNALMSTTIGRAASRRMLAVDFAATARSSLWPRFFKTAVDRQA
jgi:hypothetical protein